MIINGFIWDLENIQHIARHQVAPSEAEEVLSSDCFVTKEREGRLGLLGVTSAGRFLIVIIERRDNDFYRPYTAYDMSIRQRDFYLSLLK